MQVSFLLDENIAAPLADKLDKAGHDVERVVDVGELGEGVADTSIRLYAVQEGRLLVTSDDDFIQMSASHRCSRRKPTSFSRGRKPTGSTRSSGDDTPVSPPFELCSRVR